MKILKLGGTSVSSKSSLVNITKILSNYNKDGESVVMIVSALKGITNDLTRIIHLISERDKSYLKVLDRIKQTHWNYIDTILSAKEQILLRTVLSPIEIDFENTVINLFSKNVVTNKEKDKILSFGELFSCRIVCNLLNANGLKFSYLDSRVLIVTDDNFGKAEIDWSLTKSKILKFFHKNKKNYVVTGYIGATVNGETTTFGRGGSDYTTTILGTVLKVDSVTKWTDVNGIMSADPNNVPNARSLEVLTFGELSALTRFGSNVLVHFSAIQQLAKNNISFLIRNTFDLKFPGTLITNTTNYSQKVFSIKRDCCIISIDRIHPTSKHVLKKMIPMDLLFFRLKSDIHKGQNKAYYAISYKLLNFLNSETYITANDAVNGRKPFSMEIEQEKIHLLTITDKRMDIVFELNRIKIILAKEGIYCLDSRKFHNAISMIFEEVDINLALNILHEELIDYNKIEVY